LIQLHGAICVGIIATQQQEVHLMNEVNISMLKTRGICKPDDTRLVSIAQANVDKVNLFIRINQVKAKQGGISGMAAITKAIVAKNVLEMLEIPS